MCVCFSCFCLVPVCVCVCVCVCKEVPKVATTEKLQNLRLLAGSHAARLPVSVLLGCSSSTHFTPALTHAHAHTHTQQLLKMLRHLFPYSVSASGVTKAAGVVSRRSVFKKQLAFKQQRQKQRARFTNFETNVLGGVRSFSAGPNSSVSKSKADVSSDRGDDAERGGLFSASRVVAKPGEVTNRWRMAIPAFAAHLCIGSPYAWSAMSAPLAREFGFVCSSASDWSMSEATMPLSIVFALQGISAAAAGKWQMRVGARTAMSVAAACFGGGLIIGAAGIYTHTLSLVYLGCVVELLLIYRGRHRIVALVGSLLPTLRAENLPFRLLLWLVNAC